MESQETGPVFVERDGCTWRPARRYGHDGRCYDEPTAIFTCPRCLTPLLLPDHKIADDGTVTPAVACPVYNCDFDEVIRLYGWPPKGVDTRERTAGASTGRRPATPAEMRPGRSSADALRGV